MSKVNKIEYIETISEGNVSIMEVMVYIWINVDALKISILSRKKENPGEFSPVILDDEKIMVLAERYASELYKNGKNADILPYFKQFSSSQYEKNCDKFFEIFKNGI